MPSFIAQAFVAHVTPRRLLIETSSTEIAGSDLMFVEFVFKQQQQRNISQISRSAAGASRGMTQRRENEQRSIYRVALRFNNILALRGLDPLIHRAHGVLIGRSQPADSSPDFSFARYPLVVLAFPTLGVTAFVSGVALPCILKSIAIYSHPSGSLHSACCWSPSAIAMTIAGQRGVSSILSMHRNTYLHT